MNDKLIKIFKNKKEKRTQLILMLRIKHTLPEIAELLGYPDGVVMHFLIKGLFELDKKEQAEYIFKKLKLNKLDRDEFKLFIREKRKRRKEEEEEGEEKENK
jgi:hypothetical protein